MGPHGVKMGHAVDSVSEFIDYCKSRGPHEEYTILFSEKEMPEVIKEVKEKCREGDMFLNVRIVLDFTSMIFAVKVVNLCKIEGWESEIEA